MFEGIDGSGKSTLLKESSSLLHARARSLGFSGMIVLKEPKDTGTGRKIRERLKNHDDPGRAEWLRLFLEDREENVRENILPALSRGELILQDRYYFSTAAYQGLPGQSPSPEEIVTQNERKGFPPPDIIFFIHIEPDLALARMKGREQAAENFEKRELLERIAANYENILPAGTVRLDARETVENLLKNVLLEVEKKARSRGG